MYDPGLFPALLKNTSSNKLFHRNGGIPQLGNLDEHLKLFAKNIEELVPNKNNDGLAIIDFESWRPVYRQNFGSLEPYKELSEKVVHDQHRLWPKARVQAEANRAFESHGKQFMLKTIELAQHLRPHAKWGYYGLPFCFNGKGNNIETCARNIQLENDG